VLVYTLRQRGPAERAPLPLGKRGAEAGRLRHEVEDVNAFAAKHHVRGCLPPRWYRVFTESGLLEGRCQVAIREGPYQVMSGSVRLNSITIDGEHVAEIDVKAFAQALPH
jgi:hypothetical protein